LVPLVGVALGLAGCGNISLGNLAYESTTTPPMVLHGPDASVDDDAGTLFAEPGALADAATSTASLVSPLCFESIDDAGSCACNPDDISLPCGEVESVAVATSEDAGAAEPVLADGGATASVPQACRVTGTMQASEPAGPGGDGAQCQKGTDCAAGFECVGYGNTGQCRHYCCSGNSACPSTGNPSFCDVQHTAVGDLPVPVCMPVNSCNLVATTAPGVTGACPSTEACEVVKDKGVTSCVPIGDAQVGAPCEGDGETAASGTVSGDPFHCAAGLSCLGAVGERRCYVLCPLSDASSLVAACPSGTTCTPTAQDFQTTLVGICLKP
jgi:hypothetical protein